MRRVAKEEERKRSFHESRWRWKLRYMLTRLFKRKKEKNEVEDEFLGYVAELT